MLLKRLRRRARGVDCPLCGGHFRRFAPGKWRDGRFTGELSRCPDCNSLPRHRFFWLHATDHGLLGNGAEVLHVAPEAAIAPHLKNGAAGYVSIDLDPERAMLQADLTALPFEDGSFSLILCSHVLEHVPDDAAAMRELRRVLRADGLLVIQTPVNYDQGFTLEAPEMEDPEQRLALFSQADHVRVYGADLRERLAAAGFTVEIADAADLPQEAIDRYVLYLPSPALRNDLYLCTPRG